VITTKTAKNQKGAISLLWQHIAKMSTCS